MVTPISLPAHCVNSCTVTRNTFYPFSLFCFYFFVILYSYFLDY